MNESIYNTNSGDELMDSDAPPNTHNSTPPTIPPTTEFLSIWSLCREWSYFSLCLCMCMHVREREREVHLSWTLYTAVPSHALLMQVLQREVCYEASGPLPHTAPLHEIKSFLFM